MSQFSHLLGHGSPPAASLHERIVSHPLVAPIASNPVNVLLFFVLLYHINGLLPAPLSTLSPKIIKARHSNLYSSLPPEHPKSTVWMDYTPKTLAVYDGTGKKEATEPGTGRPEQGPPRILLSINRRVFDVTSGARFYGPDGPYGNFAGRDASRGMALQSFDEDVLTPLDQPLDTLEDLKPAERKQMLEWEQHFLGKYPVVGRLVE
ncbi:cytochrome b5, partial [Jaminaea rosea]